MRDDKLRIEEIWSKLQGLTFGADETFDVDEVEALVKELLELDPDAGRAPD